MLVKLYVGPVTPWMWDMLQKLELNVDDRGIYYKYLVHEVYIPPKQKINVKNLLVLKNVYYQSSIFFVSVLQE